MNNIGRNGGFRGLTAIPDKPHQSLISLIGCTGMTNDKLIGRMTPGAKFRRLGLIVLAAFGLASCGGGSLPDVHSLTGGIFKKKEVLLPGKRELVLKSKRELVPDAQAVNTAISIPSKTNNQNWAQPGGDASNAPGHLSYGGSLRSTWTSDAGEGSSSDGQLIPRPIVYNGRVYTMDTEAVVSSFSASGGSVGFRVSLTPETEEKDEGYGGGLAADGGRLFAATGFGTVVALDPKTGKVLWTKVLGVPVRTSPTAGNGKVFVVTTEGRLFCLSANDGEEIWSQRGLPDRTSILIQYQSGNCR